MKQVYGYIRVSTVKQGKGVSLQEQRSSILRYCQSNDLTVIEWFEEKQTAAKSGRPVFSAMMVKLKSSNVSGLVIHKIDRSARNLRDWVDIGDLVDFDKEVHFAHEAVDLKARGGRLSADIQAVIASDYVRNLKEEARKGFYGRLKQGLYPIACPVGYLDCGSGKAKEIDPVAGKVVKEAFECYATGRYSIETLRDYVNRKGLRSKRGHLISKNGLSLILRNPFYTGLIYIRSRDEYFSGVHEPLISTKLFKQVQDIKAGRKVKTRTKLVYPYRGMFVCTWCSKTMVPEKHKDHVYYRCHGIGCKRSSVRQEVFDQEAFKHLESLYSCAVFKDELKSYLQDRNQQRGKTQSQKLKSLHLQLSACQKRQERLTDLLVDEVISKEIYRERKNLEALNQNVIEEKIQLCKRVFDGKTDNSAVMLELLKKLDIQRQKQDYTSFTSILTLTCSNRTVKGKKAFVEPQKPFNWMISDLPVRRCGPSRTTLRTFLYKVRTELDQNDIDRVRKLIEIL